MRGVCSSIASEAESCGDSSRRVPGEAGRLNQPHISRRDAEICHLWLVLDRLMIPRVQTSITEMFSVRGFFFLFPEANVSFGEGRRSVSGRLGDRKVAMGWRLGLRGPCRYCVPVATAVLVLALMTNCSHQEEASTSTHYCVF